YHYADVAIQRTSYRSGEAGTSDHDIVAAINAVIAVLQDKPAPAPFHVADKKEALRLLAHYVGDVHQPLHVGAVYLDANGTVVDPDQDAFDPVTGTTGGNDLLLDRPPKKKPRNLHHEWDTVRGNVTNIPLPATVIAKAKNVQETAGPMEGWAVAWATESVLASQVAYNGLTYAPLDSQAKRYFVELPVGYNVAKGKVQRERVILGGARLAQILRKIWP